MKIFKLTLLVVCLALLTTGLIACSKNSSGSAQSSVSAADLLKKLPANALGFAVFNLQDPGLLKTFQSPAYNNMMNSLQGAGAADPKTAQGMKTYYDFMDAIGFMPKGEASSMQAADSLVFAVPKQDHSVDLAAYYSTVAGVDARTLLNNAKAALGRANISSEVLNGNGYEAITFKPLASIEGDNQVAAVYRDGLGIDAVYLGASEKVFAMSTSKELLERSFTAVNDES